MLDFFDGVQYGTFFFEMCPLGHAYEVLNNRNTLYNSRMVEVFNLTKNLIQKESLLGRLAEKDQENVHQLYYGKCLNR